MVLVNMLHHFSTYDFNDLVEHRIYKSAAYPTVSIVITGRRDASKASVKVAILGAFQAGVCMAQREVVWN